MVERPSCSDTRRRPLDPRVFELFRPVSAPETADRVVRRLTDSADSARQGAHSPKTRPQGRAGRTNADPRGIVTPASTEGPPCFFHDCRRHPGRSA